MILDSELSVIICEGTRISCKLHDLPIIDFYFQEKNVTCRGGLTWWKDHLIVGCYNYQEDKDEVR